jgi:hypothetical protein
MRSIAILAAFPAVKSHALGQRSKIAKSSASTAANAGGRRYEAPEILEDAQLPNGLALEEGLQGQRRYRGAFAYQLADGGEKPSVQRLVKVRGLNQR